MATYAAYRHVELDHVGYGKRRVLKPPGGGSSDIFGATEPDQSPRRVKTHMASNINLSDTTDSSSASSTASSDSPTPTSPGPRKQDKDDAEAIEIEQTPSSAAELQSETCEAAAAPVDESSESAPADSEESAESAVAAEQVSAESEQQAESAPAARKNHMQSNIVLGDDRPVERKVSGGESLQNGGGPKSNGAPAAPRSRVPPGGYSSGLW